MLRGIDLVEAVRRAAQLREQPQLAGPAKARGREPLELPEDPLARGRSGERGVASHQRLRLGIQPQAELVLEPHGAKQPERIGAEDLAGDGAQRARLEIRDAAERIDVVGRAEPPRDRVHGEVAASRGRPRSRPGAA